MDIDNSIMSDEIKEQLLKAIQELDTNSLIASPIQHRDRLVEVFTSIIDKGCEVDVLQESMCSLMMFFMHHMQPLAAKGILFYPLDSTKNKLFQLRCNGITYVVTLIEEGIEVGIKDDGADTFRVIKHCTDIQKWLKLIISPILNHLEYEKIEKEDK